MLRGLPKQRGSLGARGSSRWCYVADVSDLGRQDPRPVVLIWYLYQRKIAKTLSDIKPESPAQLRTDRLDAVTLLHSHCPKAHPCECTDSQSPSGKAEQPNVESQWSLPLSRTALLQEPHDLSPPCLAPALACRNQVANPRETFTYTERV